MVAQQTLTLYVWVRALDPQPKNPTRKSWIFSFVPLGTTSFAVVRFANPEHATSFDRQVNIIAVCGTNERGLRLCLK